MDAVDSMGKDAQIHTARPLDYFFNRITPGPFSATLSMTDEELSNGMRIGKIEYGIHGILSVQNFNVCFCRPCQGKLFFERPCLQRVSYHPSKGVNQAGGNHKYE
jgi:hypothetical protein